MHAGGGVSVWSPWCYCHSGPGSARCNPFSFAGDVKEQMDRYAGGLSYISGHVRCKAEGIMLAAAVLPIYSPFGAVSRLVDFKICIRVVE